MLFYFLIARLYRSNAPKKKLYSGVLGFFGKKIMTIWQGLSLQPPGPVSLTICIFDNY